MAKSSARARRLWVTLAVAALLGLALVLYLHETAELASTPFVYPVY